MLAILKQVYYALAQGPYVAINVVRVHAVASDLRGLYNAPLHELDDIGPPYVHPPLRIPIIAVSDGIFREVGVVSLKLLNGPDVDIAQNYVVGIGRGRFLKASVSRRISNSTPPPSRHLAGYTYERGDDVGVLDRVEKVNVPNVCVRGYDRLVDVNGGVD